MRHEIRKRGRDFAAILVLALVAGAVATVILSQQRLTLPGWVPLVGKDVFTLKGEFQTAQAVTPGQGQTVNIAGVKVGEVSKVELSGGRALVTMKIEPKYAAVYHDARMLLRPRTGLKDMLVELQPGDPGTGKLHSGDTVPIQSTLPDVNPDEVLAVLDGDTRDYLRLLLAGAGQGLRGGGTTLSMDLRRFAPTARDVRKITELLAQRRRNLSRVIHNFGLLTTELAGKDEQLGQLVDSSNAVFRRFANQDGAIQAILQQLPGTLEETQRGLGKANALASTLGPTLQALRPAARSLGPALRDTRPFLRDTTPIIRDHLRPFARDTLPVARDLRPAVTDLAAVSPDLIKVFRVANYLLNELAYNPPGDREEGYLFWLSWANHAGNSLFATQDAHGPLRHGLLVASCDALNLLDQLASANPQLGLLQAMTNAPSKASVCPATRTR